MDMMFEMHQNSQSFQSLLENKLNYIIDKMDNLSAHDVAARIQDQAEYHDDVVKAQFPELPYNSVQTLTTVNTSLADKNLAVSLVGFLYNTYKSEADVKKFVNRMYITIFGDSASQKLQWRSAPKTNDKR